MSETVVQGETLGLVYRIDDETDRRAKKVLFTSRGEAWLEAFHEAINQAEVEMRQVLGKRRASALVDALMLYGQGFDTLEHGPNGPDQE